MAGTHLVIEPALMGDEKGFQCCDAIRTSDPTPVNALIFSPMGPSVHEKEIAKFKRGAPWLCVAPAQQWGNNSEDVITAPKFMIRKS